MTARAMRDTVSRCVKVAKTVTGADTGAVDTGQCAGLPVGRASVAEGAWRGGHVETRIGTNEAADATERALVTRIANNDHLAMNRFVLLYGARLTRFLRRLTWRQELVEEIINDTMFIVWQQAGRFRFESRVSSWVIAIAYRRAVRVFRAESRRRVAQPAAEEDWWSDEAQEQFETTEWLGRALLKLPFEQRTALELVYHAGYSCEEVGEIMGCPASTVKTRMFHARRKLRLALPAAAGLDNCKRRVLAA
jgi:RNA polymerase sigma-70 factor, ECF subfamily